MSKLKYITPYNLVVVIVLALFLLFAMGMGHDYHYMLSPFLFLLSCVYIFSIFPKIFYTPLLLILCCFIPLVLLSSVNYFYYDSVEINYVQYVSYSLLIYIYPLFVYNVGMTKKSAVHVLLFCFYLFWIVSIFYFMRTYGSMLSRGLDKSAFNAFYYVLMPLPALLMYNDKRLQWIVLLVTFIVCLFSLKRSAILGVSSILLAFFYDNMRNSSHRLLYVIFLLLFIVSLSFFIVKTGLLERFDLLMDRMENISEDGGSGRFDIIRNFVQQDFSHFGLEQYLFGNGFMATKIKYVVLESLHNDWLEIFNSFGILGIILLLLFFVLLLRKVVFLYIQNSRLFVSYFAIFTLFFLYSLVGGSFYFICLSLPLFVALALGEILCNNRIK